MALGATIALATTATPAVATPSDPPDRSGEVGPKGQVARTSMQTRGLDAKQAKRAGNKIVTRDGYQLLINGKTGAEIARVPTGDNASRSKAYGDCGMSYLYLFENGKYDNVFTFKTGFDLDGAAHDFDWYVGFNGPGGGYWRWIDSGPQVPGKKWDSGSKEEYSAEDGVVEGVVENSSRAYMSDGRVCWAAGAWDEIYVK